MLGAEGLPVVEPLSLLAIGAAAALFVPECSTWRSIGIACCLYAAFLLGGAHV